LLKEVRRKISNLSVSKASSKKRDTGEIPEVKEKSKKKFTDVKRERSRIDEALANDDSENRQQIEHDKLDLELTLAIIDDDKRKFAQAQRQLREILLNNGSKMPEHIMMPINELKALRGSIFRQLISRSL